MEELKNYTYDEHNGLRYTLVGDYYIPDLELTEEPRPIGIWGADAQRLFGAVSSSPVQ